MVTLFRYEMQLTLKGPDDHEQNEQKEHLTPYHAPLIMQNRNFAKCQSCLARQCKKHPLQDHGDRMARIKKEAAAKGGSVDELIKQQIARLQNEADDVAEAEQAAYKMQMEVEREAATKKRKRMSKGEEALLAGTSLNAATAKLLAASSDEEDEASSSDSESSSSSSDESEKDRKKRKENARKKEVEEGSQKEKKRSRRRRSASRRRKRRRRSERVKVVNV